CLQFKTFPYRF
nr:immunoglobulin light chain junction region [Macaca mulatta]